MTTPENFHLTNHPTPPASAEGNALTVYGTLNDAAVYLDPGVLRPGPARPSIAPFLFTLGQAYATPAALELLASYDVDTAEVLNRHARGDWGDVDFEDRHANEEAVERDRRILSAYILRKPGEPARDSDPRLWCVTEADRSATVILLPHEY